ncbi:MULTISPECIES: ArdC family protein [unclassified Psychrobacillus]|uniref:ArdC family protein n=1 Tax=unclassified Psychrobacillus TaxID=2636677 RepID=UPI0030F9F8C5
MTKKSFTRRTATEKKEQVEGLMQQLEDGVLHFSYEPEKYKAILQMQALMYDYSFNNIMLIAQQCPNARYIASFNRWKELNRFVKKGEKAIRILAPRFKLEKDEITGEVEKKKVGFIGVSVFDVSQTEGEPLSIDAHALTLDGESDEAIRIFEWVKLLAEEDDCPLHIGFANGSNGYYRPSTHEIMIGDHLSINHRAKTAVHELVHSRVHCHTHAKTSKEEMESVAEGVAFIICSYFGLDTSDYSFEYVRGWSSDNGESLRKYGEIIQKTANSLIADFERVATAIPMKEVTSNEFTSNQISA